MRKWYVYAHVNPVNGETFYIGKGTGKRARDIGRNTSWHVYVNSLEERGLTYGVQILHICDDEQNALDLENIEIINRLKAGQALLNRKVERTLDENGEPAIACSPTISNNSELIKFVKQRRLSINMTQADVAWRSGVGVRFVRELERGKLTLRIDKVNQVLNLFGSKLIPK
jgi:hypothetical protein